MFLGPDSTEFRLIAESGTRFLTLTMAEPPRKLFGTDGIRGKAGVFPIDPATAYQLGRAAGQILAPEKSQEISRSVVIGRDTRESGPELEAAIARGFAAAGFEVRLAGVIPTPAVALAVNRSNAALGVVISASHNPFEDNGIKFFGADGYKLSDKTESEIEALLLSFLDENRTGDESGGSRISDCPRAEGDYVEYAVSTIGNVESPPPLEGLAIAIDLSNGAAYRTSPEILRRLGATVRTFHDEPDGTNINNGCGCTHPARIEALTRETGAGVGISHDGDADRVALCDETGSALDGDDVLAIVALHRMAAGGLKDNIVVSTLMSNAALDRLLKDRGGRLIRTNVGDRHVIDEMRRGGYDIGGEQSGHLIFRPHSTTGDGIVAALQVLAIMRETGKPLSELRKVLEKYPQAQVNVKVREKPLLSDLPAVSNVISAVEKELDGDGRVLVRYSGTEALLRILVEGPSLESITEQAGRIAAAIESKIGFP